MRPFGLYGMADAGWGDPLSQARILAEEGVGWVQLRCKDWSDERLLRLGEACMRLGPVVVINDRVEVARKIGARVHLGQEDGPDPEVPFGRSTHDRFQASASGRAEYIGFGPVFASTTKPGEKVARGPARLAEAVFASPVPVVAIGGITVENLAEVKEAGAAAWAVIGAIWGAPDPRSIIRALR